MFRDCIITESEFLTNIFDKPTDNIIKLMKKYGVKCIHISVNKKGQSVVDIERFNKESV